MPTISFTSGNDSYAVIAAGTYDLSFLAGADLLTVNGGTFTTAHMGDDNDVATLRSGDASVFGDLGNDRFEIYAAGIEADGGAGADVFNLRGSANVTLAGGDGADRFNFAGAAAGVLIHGGLGDDSYAGYDMAIGGALHGDEDNDTFTGFRSGVTLYGGLGNDVYRLNTVSNATFTELAGQGVDIVQLMRGADYTLPDNIERIIVGTYAGSDTSSATVILNLLDNGFTGHGNAETVFGMGGVDRMFGKAGDDTLYGGDGNDLADGGAGNDTLDGGAGNDTLVGRSGDDIMSGGGGQDIYYVDGAADQTIEAAGQGYDRVLTSLVSTVLADNVEQGSILLATGASLTGNASDNSLGGNAGADVFMGLAGNDKMSGGDGNDSLDGGTGDDVMNGGTDNDTYYVDSLGDVVFEYAGEGTDVVNVSASGYTLTDNIETGIVVGPAGVALTGNALGNSLTGNAGDDTLNGGTGIDTLTGGLGNDTYVIDTLSDVVVENAGEGTDTVQASIFGYSLPNYVENGTVAAGALYGNELDNVLGAQGASSVTLNGGNGNDTLNGSSSGDTLDGGFGDDIAIGGAGNDTYWVFQLADQLIENPGDGTDNVYVSVSGYTLGDNVENASFSIYLAGGTINGSNVDNILTGKDAADVLTGAGGNDTLYGGYAGDTLSGGDGNDALYGYGPSDGSFGNDFLNVLNGGNGDDVLTGARHTDTLNGDAGNDILYGDIPGSDQGMADTLDGGSENDVLVGGLARDTLTGGSGADTFKYVKSGVTESPVSASGFDLILDFLTGTDKIDLSGIDANTGIAGDQAFSYNPLGATSAGQITWVPAGGGHYTVYANVDGGSADFQLDVVTTGLAIADFVF